MSECEREEERNRGRWGNCIAVTSYYGPMMVSFESITVGSYYDPVVISAITVSFILNPAVIRCLQ